MHTGTRSALSVQQGAIQATLCWQAQRFEQLEEGVLRCTLTFHWWTLGGF